uniref:Cation-transporting P-type ATPase C-terminal domain-containing protein n=1 Tax=Octactis speculum TaxID=3111310 RepID=A0A7S2H429_9STRA
MSFGLWSVCLYQPSMKSLDEVVLVNEYEMDAISNWNATTDSTTGCTHEADRTTKSSLLGIASKDVVANGYSAALFCNGDRSYDRYVSTLRRVKMKAKYDLLDKWAKRCHKLDNHHHQLLYCEDVCHYQCDQIRPKMRYNDTYPYPLSAHTHLDHTTSSTMQCANFASRMVQRHSLESAQTAFLVAVVLCQIAAAITFKNRWNSFGVYGSNNDYINYGIAIALMITFLVSYSEIGHSLFGAEKLKFSAWLPGIPFALMIFGFDEIRRYLMRLTSTNSITGDEIIGWLEKMTYF